MSFIIHCRIMAKLELFKALPLNQDLVNCCTAGDRTSERCHREERYSFSVTVLISMNESEGGTRERVVR